MLSPEKMGKWKEFRRIWTVEKIQNMTLGDYHTVGAKEKCFTWWMEYGLKFLGEMGGGKASIFRIYNKATKKTTKKDSSAKGCIESDGYVWLSKYGKTKEEAFESVREKILDVIKYSQNNELEKIDGIDLGDVYKWKIAFCYQETDDPKIIPIYKKDVLKKIADDFGGTN